MRSVDSGGILLSQVAMSHSGKMLFCGTVLGTVRSFKFPFSDVAEWNELQGHAMQITKVQLEYPAICN